MKKYFKILILLPFFSLAQVGIGTTTPNGALDIQSSNNGLVIPRVQLTSIADNVTVVNPNASPLLTSTLVYNLAPAGVVPNNVVAGFYYWNNIASRWIAVNGVAGWELDGNTAITNPVVPVTYGTSTIGVAENFLGTTDANDITFGTNTIERMRIKQTTGNVGIGLANPLYKLDALSNDFRTGNFLNNYLGNSDRYGVYSSSVNAPGYGLGGYFEGGYKGAYFLVTATTYTGDAYGIDVRATGSAGNRYGGNFSVSGTGTTNYAGFFSSTGATNNYGVIVPNGSGRSGFGTVVPEQVLTSNYGLNIDQNNSNTGTPTNALTFGSGSGEGIGSKRSATGNPFGLDFYTNFVNRMRIFNPGEVVIGQNSGGVITPGVLGSLNSSLTVWNPSTVSGTTDIPVLIAKHSGSSGTTWQMGSIEYYTEGEANIGFTYQLSPLNSHTGTNLGDPIGSKYLGFRWNQLFCSVAPNVSSDITLKKDIQKVPYGIHQLRDINPISYKFKKDNAGTDSDVPDDEKRTHIGFSAQELKQIVPEIVSSWDYMSNNEEGYIKAKTPTLGVIYEEIIPVTVNAIKQLDQQQQDIIKTFTISDFGTIQSNTDEVLVNYSAEFIQKLQGNPIVTITATVPNANYFIKSQDKKGFVVKNNNPNQTVSFNWMTMAKINEKSLEIKTDYTPEIHQQKLSQIAAFESSLPTSEAALSSVMAKIKAKNSQQKAQTNPAQEQMIKDAEKVRENTQKLQKEYLEHEKTETKKRENINK